MKNDIGEVEIGKIIQNDFIELLEKEKNGTITNDDFMRTWTDVVILPMARIEEIVRFSKHTEEGYTNHQAILYGLLLRIMSILSDERRLACARLINYRSATVFSRMLMETTINLLYLIQNDAYADTFCKLSAKADKEFMQDIYKNRRRREKEGEIVDEQFLKYEDGLLESAKNAVMEAGTNNSKDNQKQTSMKEKAKAVGLEQIYSPYGLESHTIHGDWIDLSRNYLSKHNEVYYPKFEEEYVDIRKLNPLLDLIYEALIQFIQNYEGHGLDKGLLKSLNRERDIISHLDYMHYNYVHRQPLLSGM